MIIFLLLIELKNVLNKNKLKIGYRIIGVISIESTHLRLYFTKENEKDPASLGEHYTLRAIGY